MLEAGRLNCTAAPPPEKVSELYKSEREFNDEVLKQLSERSVKAGD